MTFLIQCTVERRGKARENTRRGDKVQKSGLIAPEPLHCKEAEHELFFHWFDHD